MGAWGQTKLQNATREPPERQLADVASTAKGASE
jgi:hypothetical protein